MFFKNNRRPWYAYVAIRRNGSSFEITSVSLYDMDRNFQKLLYSGQSGKDAVALLAKSFRKRR